MIWGPIPHVVRGLGVYSSFRSVKEGPGQKSKGRGKRQAPPLTWFRVTYIFVYVYLKVI